MFILSRRKSRGSWGALSGDSCDDALSYKRRTGCRTLGPWRPLPRGRFLWVVWASLALCWLPGQPVCVSLSQLALQCVAKPPGNWQQLAVVEGELVGGGHRGGEGHREGGREGGESSTGLQLLDVVAQLSCCLGGEKVRELFVEGKKRLTWLERLYCGRLGDGRECGGECGEGGRVGLSSSLLPSSPSLSLLPSPASPSP